MRRFGIRSRANTWSTVFQQSQHQSDRAFCRFRWLVCVPRSLLRSSESPHISSQPTTASLLRHHRTRTQSCLANLASFPDILSAATHSESTVPQSWHSMSKVTWGRPNGRFLEQLAPLFFLYHFGPSLYLSVPLFFVAFGNN